MKFGKNGKMVISQELGNMPWRATNYCLHIKQSVFVWFDPGSYVKCNLLSSFTECFLQTSQTPINKFKSHHSLRAEMSFEKLKCNMSMQPESYHFPVLGHLEFPKTVDRGPY